MRKMKKILAMATAVGISMAGLLITSPAYAVEGVIPDEGLGQCFNLSLGRDIDTPITAEDVANFNGYLECSDAGINSLQGLENLNSLEYINLNNNSFTNVDELANITVVNTLDLSSNPNLTSIDGLATADIQGNLNLSFTNVADLSALENSNASFLILDETPVTNVSVTTSMPNLRGVSLPNSVTDYAALVSVPTLTTLYAHTVTEANVSQIISIPNLSRLTVWDYQINSLVALSEIAPQLNLLQMTGRNITDLTSIQTIGANSAQSAEVNINTGLWAVNPEPATYSNGSLSFKLDTLPAFRDNGSVDDFTYEIGIPYEDVAYANGILTFTGVDGDLALGVTSVDLRINATATLNGVSTNPFPAVNASGVPTEVYYYASVSFPSIINVDEPPVEQGERNLVWVDENGETNNSIQVLNLDAGTTNGGILPEASLDFAILDTTVSPSVNSVCETPTVTGENAETFIFTNASDLGNTITIRQNLLADMETGTYIYNINCGDTGLSNSVISFVINLTNVIEAAPIEVAVTECPVMTYVIEGDDVIVTMPLTGTAADEGENVKYNLPVGYYDGFTIIDAKNDVTYVASEEFYEADVWNLNGSSVNNGVRTIIGETLVVTYPGAANAFVGSDYNATINANVWQNFGFILVNNVWVPEAAIPFPVSCNFSASVAPPVEPPVVEPPVVNPPVISDPAPVDDPKQPNTPDTIKNGGENEIMLYVLGGLGVLLLLGGAATFIVRRKTT